MLDSYSCGGERFTTRTAHVSRKSSMCAASVDGSWLSILPLVLVLGASPTACVLAPALSFPPFASCREGCGNLVPDFAIFAILRPKIARFRFWFFLLLRVCLPTVACPESLARPCVLFTY